MKICIMTGARPNFMKVAPLIKAIENHRDSMVEYSLVYAGCEDDPTLEGSLFEDLDMKRPDVYLGVGSHNVNEITGEVMGKFEAYLHENKHDVVIVVDDLASTMAAAIVAKKQGLKLAHLVAGTRSFNINMPKEINRLVIDGLSDYLFTAGMHQGTTADQSKIYVVGNILMDTLRQNYQRFRRPEVILEGVKDGEYGVLTVNRKALLADPEKMKKLFRVIDAAGVPVFAVVRGKEFEGYNNIKRIEALPYLEFGYLTSHAKVVITDSGNIAEEATFNGIPCITLNDYTEHQETVKEGTNILVNEDPELLKAALEGIMKGQEKVHSIPDFWDGRTAERILRALLETGEE